MPLVPPVTNTVLPSNRFITNSPFVRLTTKLTCRARTGGDESQKADMRAGSGAAAGSARPLYTRDNSVTDPTIATDVARSPKSFSLYHWSPLGALCRSRRRPRRLVLAPPVQSPGAGAEPRPTARTPAASGCTGTGRHPRDDTRPAGPSGRRPLRPPRLLCAPTTRHLPPRR